MACFLSKAPILYRATLRKTIILGPVTKITRGVNHDHLTNRTSLFVQQKFRLQDNISSDYKLIYREQKFINLCATIGYNGGWVGVILGAFLAGYLILVDPPVMEESKDQIFQDGVMSPLSKPVRAIMVFVACTFT